MKRDRSIAPLLVAAVMLIPAGLAGQGYPLTPVFELAAPYGNPSWGIGNAYSGPILAVAMDSRFAVSWTASWINENNSGDENDSPVGRFVSSAGEPGPSFAGYFGEFCNSPVLAPAPGGRLVGVWSGGNGYDRADAYLQSWDRNGDPLLDWDVGVNDSEKAERHDNLSIGVDAEGRVVVVWEEWAEHGTGWLITPKLRIFSPALEPLTPELTLPPAQTPPFSPRVMVDESGRILVVWSENSPDELKLVNVWGRHFAMDGTPLDRPFFVVRGDSVLLAPQPGGGFVVFWTRVPRGEGAGLPIARLRRFGPDGHPIGPPVLVGSTGAFEPQLAVDHRGNVAVLTAVGEEAAVRLFNYRLAPRGEPIPLGLREEDLGHNLAWRRPLHPIGLALDDRRRFLIAWVDSKPKFEDAVHGRIWSVGEDDLCVYRGNGFLCDTAGDGGAHEAVFRFGDGSPGHIPLVGDVDGDGRADLCLYRNGLFACDTHQDAGHPEMRTAPFGRPGDFVFLADVDGDGRADPCVRRGTRFLCDRARDGGAPDFAAGFGTEADIGVMGDVDDDGRDDPCVYRNGFFLCDTAHDGGAAEIRLNLQRVLGDAGLLGQGTPLLGDVNGDGRADPCLWSAGRLVCGIVPQGGRFPAQVIERRFGAPGDVPVLGDVDAF